MEIFWVCLDPIPLTCFLPFFLTSLLIAGFLPAADPNIRAKKSPAERTFFHRISLFIAFLLEYLMDTVLDEKPKTSTGGENKKETIP